MPVDTTILGAATLLALAMGSGSGATEFHSAPAPTPADYPGVWRSADGEVRLVLHPDRTYERSITGRETVARGRYRLSGATLRLHDDCGLRTTVTVVNGALEMAGHVLYRG
ncbi:MAG TPA: Atu4866 domain-containing protein [Actinoplanes sp.]|nr:Atu4866 domain-containing protein [Actinoplanes sp.]